MINAKKISDKASMSEKLKEGIILVASIVKRTLGPGGLPVLIERNGQNLEGDPLEPMITKDGVTVANECSSEDPEIDLGIQTVKAICKKTNKIAGDGTTTAIVLGESIYLETLKELQADSHLNPQIVKTLIQDAVNAVVVDLKTIAVEVNDFEKIEQVANISSNGDKEIATIIRQAFEHVGSEGVITIDEGSSNDVTIDRVEGFQFARGAERGDVFFNSANNSRFEAQNVVVLIYDGKIESSSALIPLFNKIQEEMAKMGGGIGHMPPILFIANEYSSDAMQLLMLNKMGNIQEGMPGLPFVAVKGPNTTTVRSAMLDDLAVYLGGRRLGNGNRSIFNLDAQGAATDEGAFRLVGDLGFAKKVIIDRYTTTIYGGGGTEEEIKARVDQLTAAKESVFSPYDLSILNDRIAALTGGIAKIGVGGRTDLEIKEKYHRIEDALNASRAAIEMGVIPGGGSALYRISEKLKDSDKIGERILSRALKAPLNQILDNIGLDHKSINLTDLINSPTMVYDAMEGKFCDAFEAGIIDPLKVTITALQNATSISGLLSTCGGGITYLRK